MKGILMNLMKISLNELKITHSVEYLG